MNLPATISRLLSISEKGAVIKKNPRYDTKKKMDVT